MQHIKISDLPPSVRKIGLKWPCCPENGRQKDSEQIEEGFSGRIRPRGRRRNG